MSKKIPKLVREVQESKLKQSPKSNKHISYSQLSSFASCQKQWYLTYVKNLAPYQPSIHAVFGTAMHETIQTWLDKIYNGTVKAAMEMDLDSLLYENMIKAYKAQKVMNSHNHFSTSDELTMFWIDGKHILKYLKSKRSTYFSTKKTYLAGIETLLYQELRPGVMFKGLIDLVFYDELYDKWTIMDIKTSTSGWNDYTKKDDVKISQILLYKEFFAKQFNIDPDRIEVVYFILKRKVPVDAEYPAMERRVQEFRPASGKIKRGQAVSLVNNFVKTAVDESGEYIDKDYQTFPSKSNCRFCVFKDLFLCKDAVL